MKRVVAFALGIAASVGRAFALPFLLIGSIATPILETSAACERAAREWDPRLWDRDHDPGSDNREHRR